MLFSRVSLCLWLVLSQVACDFGAAYLREEKGRGRVQPAMMDPKEGDQNPIEPVYTALRIDLELASLPMNLKSAIVVKALNASNTFDVVTDKVKWFSSDDNIAVVEENDNGKSFSVRALAPGDATIKAQFQALTEKIDVHVSDPKLESLKIGALSNSSPIGGEGVQLNVTGTYDNGWTVNLTNNVEWKSETKGIAVFSLTNRGLLFGLTKGQAKVTATIDGFSALGTHTFTDAIVREVYVGCDFTPTLFPGCTVSPTVACSYSRSELRRPIYEGEQRSLAAYAYKSDCSLTNVKDEDANLVFKSSDTSAITFPFSMDVNLAKFNKSGVYEITAVYKGINSKNKLITEIFPVATFSQLILHLDPARVTNDYRFPGIGCETSTWLDLSITAASVAAISANCGQSNPKWRGVGSASDPFRFALLDDLQGVVLINQLSSFALSEFTIAMWVKAKPGNNFRPLMVRQISSSNRNFWFGLSAGGSSAVGPKGALYFGASSRGVANSFQNPGKTAVDDDKWHFAVMSLGNGFSALSLDGKVESQKSHSGEVDKPSNALPLIGADGQGANLNGEIGYIAMFERVLTTTEVQQFCKVLQHRFPGGNCH